MKRVRMATLVLLMGLLLLTGAVASAPTVPHVSYLPIIQKPLLSWSVAYAGQGGVRDQASAATMDREGNLVWAGEFSHDNFNSDFWLMKMTPTGNVLWEKIYGGANEENLHAFQATDDNGFVLAGLSDSFGGPDGWMIKVNAQGNLLWQRRYGGAVLDVINAVANSDDGGFITAGATASKAGSTNLWVMRLDPGGNIIWQKTYDYAVYDTGHDIQRTADGGYLIAAFSYDPYHPVSWLLKLAADGRPLWRKVYAGVNIRRLERAGADFVVAGSIGQESAANGWVARLDDNGNILWQRQYGGAGIDEITTILPLTTGDFLVAGSTDSFGAGFADGWLLRLKSDGLVAEQNSYGTAGNDGFEMIAPINNGYLLAGHTGGSAGYFDAWLLKLDPNGKIANCPLAGTGQAASSPTALVPKELPLTGANALLGATVTAITPQVSVSRAIWLCPAAAEAALAGRAPAPMRQAQLLAAGK